MSEGVGRIAYGKHAGMDFAASTCAKWLDHLAQRKATGEPAQGEPGLMGGLRELDASLRASSNGKLNGTPLMRFLKAPATLLDANGQDLAKRLYLDLYVRQGHALFELRSLLALQLAVTASPDLIPFWNQVFDLSRQNDQSINERRIIALAGLMLIEMEHPDAGAALHLRTFMRHRDRQIREAATVALASVYLYSGRRLPDYVAEVFGALLDEEQTLLSRFILIREAFASGESIYLWSGPLRYDFELRSRSHPEYSMVIAVRRDNLFESLHRTCRQVIGVAAEATYGFYLNGVAFDHRYEVAMPTSGHELPLALQAQVLTAFLDDAPQETVAQLLAEVQSALADSAPKITARDFYFGTLEWKEGDTFAYVPDLSSNRVYDVTCVEGHKRTGNGILPRVVPRRQPRQQ